jgi:hypothetical protein
MRSMNLTMVYDFLQVIGIKRSYSTKDDYFSKYIQFTTIYLLQKQKLKHKNYSKPKINMSYFIQTTKNDLNMYASIQD